MSQITNRTLNRLSVVLAFCALAAAVLLLYQQRMRREGLDQSEAYERFSEIVETASQSVVALDAEQESGVRNVVFQNIGSGFILDGQGHILTNEHVVHEAKSIRVTLADRRKLYAKLVGGDPRTDLAVLKVEAGELKPLPPAEPGKLAVGQIVIALGNPLGTGADGRAVATFGRISRLNQSLQGGIDLANDRYYDNLIQTNAITLPGNSGGPLINTQGQVIGVNTAMATSRDEKRSFGFAIALDERTLAKIAALKEGQEPAHAFLGVSTVDIPAAVQSRLGLEDASGALVDMVLLGSPAQQEGLRRGDVIVRLGGERIYSPGELMQRINQRQPGEVVQVEIIRSVENEPEKREVAIPLVSRTVRDLEGYQEEARLPSLLAWGLELKDLTAWRKSKLGLEVREGGVLVYEVEAGSEAEREGIRPGAVITAVGQNKVDNLREFAIVAKDSEQLPRLVIRQPEPDFGDW